MNDILDWINVGKLSAERDDNLSSYFFDNGVLSSVIDSPSSFLILGRKGAGKTAIFRHLTQNPTDFIESKDILVSLSFEDYNWSVHALLNNEYAAESLAYKQSWRFVILAEVIKAYHNKFKKEGTKPPSKLDKGNKVLEKIFNTPFPSISQLIGRKLLALGKIKLPSGGLGFDDDSLDNLNIDAGELTFDAVSNDATLRDQLCNNIDYLISYFEEIIKSIQPMTSKVYICFDRIDEAWDDVSFDVSRKVIAGLVTAADAITPKYNGNIRPLIFLREDIFEVLSLNDSNKLREDCGALLHWDRDSLAKLILKRINFYAEINSNSKINDIDDIFDKPEMRQRLKPSNYLIKRSMMRPRDLISLMSKTISSMKDEKNDPFGEDSSKSEKIEVEYIYQAEPSYSEWLKQEINDEWAVQRPEIKLLLAAIQNNASTIITREELSIEMKKIDNSTHDDKTLEFLMFLFENSIVGFKIGQSIVWRFKCFYPSQGFIDSDQYKIHDGLIRSLNLKEPREKTED